MNAGVFLVCGKVNSELKECAKASSAGGFD